jgi:hypothetical protein
MPMIANSPPIAEAADIVAAGNNNFSVARFVEGLLGSWLIFSCCLHEITEKQPMIKNIPIIFFHFIDSRLKFLNGFIPLEIRF